MFALSNAFQAYLDQHGFSEVPVLIPQQPGLEIRAFENSEFRLHLVNERKNEHYVQVAPLGKPEERHFLPGLVAFFTGDATATRTSGKEADWLTIHHAALALFFSPSSAGQIAREQFSNWQKEFAAQEQARLHAAAQAAREAKKARPWWKFW